MMDGVFGEIELAILREWPSKRAALSARGSSDGRPRFRDETSVTYCLVKRKWYFRYTKSGRGERYEQQATLWRNPARGHRELGEGARRERRPSTGRGTTARCSPTAELALQGRTSPGPHPRDGPQRRPEALPRLEVPQPHGRLVHARALRGPDRLRSRRTASRSPRSRGGSRAMPTSTTSSSTACAGATPARSRTRSSRFGWSMSSDAQAAILMHLENADRQDITPMERALSFQVQLDAQALPDPGGARERAQRVEGAGHEDAEGGAAPRPRADRESPDRSLERCRWSRPTSSRR